MIGVLANIGLETNINNVEKKGGGRISQMSTILQADVVKLSTKGEGIKILKVLSTYYMDAPYTGFIKCPYYYISLT